jgi:hypothetical protein
LRRAGLLRTAEVAAITIAAAVAAAAELRAEVFLRAHATAWSEFAFAPRPGPA